MKTKLKYLLIASILMVSVFSCVKDNFNFDKWDKEVQYDASFAAPVAWGDLAFTDALRMYDSTGLFIVNEEGYVSLQYLTRVSSNKVNEIIYLNNQNVNGTVESPDFNFAQFSAFHYSMPSPHRSSPGLRERARDHLLPLPARPA